MNTQLFIEKYQIDLTDDIDFPINKRLMDIADPSKIKDDYSKTIKIPMTPNNDRVFGFVYKINKVIETATGVTNINTNFNPSRKANFELKYKGDTLMSGYAMLDDIDENDQYNLHLFGSRGGFIRKLENKYLSDIVFNTCPSNTGLSYTVDRDVVYDLMTNERTEAEYDGSDLEDHLTFVSANQGVYSNMENKKFYISLYTTGATTTTGSTTDDLTELETLNFLTYKQRPSIYFNKIMENMIGNLGYTLELHGVDTDDYYKTIISFKAPDKFNDSSDFNGYFTPKESGFTFTTGATAMQIAHFDTVTDPSGIAVNDYAFYTANFRSRSITGNFNILYRLKYRINAAAVAYNRTFDIKNICFVAMFTGVWYHQSGYFTAANSRVIIPANSQEGYLEFQDSVSGLWYNTYTASSQYNYNPMIDGYGSFPLGEIMYITVLPDVYGSGYVLMYSGSDYTGDVTFEIVPTNSYWRFTASEIPRSYSILDIKDFVTPAKIEQKKLFVSFLKHFNLYFDVDENTKTVHVYTYKEWFKDYKILDWSGKVDYSKERNLKPINFNKKYLNLSWPKDGSTIGLKYSTKYNQEYFSKKLDTGYEFNSDVEDLIQDSVINVPIVNCPFSIKYFNKFMATKDDIGFNLIDRYPSYRLDGYHADIYADIEKDGKALDDYYFGYKIKTGKPRHEDTGTTYGYWFLSDDAPSGTTFLHNRRNISNLNTFEIVDSSMFDTKHVKQLDSIYTVSNYLIDETEWLKDNLVIEKSLDYAVPYEIYFPFYIDITYNDSSTLYYRYFQNILEDRYSVQTKIRTLYVKLNAMDIATFSFKNFVKIDDQLYMVNQIYDYNVAKNDTTKVELVKINNIQNYIT